MDDEEVLTRDRDRYEQAIPRFRAAAHDVAREIHAVARREGIPVRVEGREKSLDSFVKKSLVKRYTSPWADTTDKAGARAIVLNPRDLYPLVEALERHWADRRAGPRQDKALELGDNVFDYSGVHLQVVAPRLEDDTEPIECEVQVRTAAQDAWSVLSHQFLYKAAADVSQGTRRAWFRLVALVEVFDGEVERTVSTVLKDPAYPQGQILQAAERAFWQFASRDYNRDLSDLVLQAAVNAVPEAERATYGDRLLAFVEEQRERIQDLLIQFAPDTEQGKMPRYALLTQPEALVLIERAEHAQMLLLDAIDEYGSDMHALVDPVLAAWGKPFPILD